MYKYYNKSLYILLSISILTLSISCYYFWQKYQQEQLIKTSFNNTITLLPVITPIPMDNWITYVNTKYKYLVKIPPGWEAERGNPSGFYTDKELQELASMYWRNNGLGFRVVLVGVCADLDSCFKEYQMRSDKSIGTNSKPDRHTTRGYKIRPIIFHGLPAIESKSTFSEDVNSITGIFFIYKGNLWLIEGENSPSLKWGDQIISTFKFT